MKTRYLLLVFTLFSSISYAQEIGFPIIRNYTPKEYRNAPQVTSVIRDSRGIMYFGVGDIVMEYDGISWRQILNEKQATPYDLTIDKNGRIYVAANGEFGYLTTDKAGNTKYQSLTHLIRDTTLKLGIVRSVSLTSKFAYFRTYDAILQYTYTPENIQVYNASNSGVFTGDFVYQDIYYTQLDKKGLMKIENNELRPALQSSFFKDKNCFDVALPYNAKTLLIPTQTNGLYLYQPSKDTIPIKLNISNNDFIVNNSISTASVFRNEYFVLGSITKGALLFDKYGAVLQQYQESKLLQNNQVRDITTDTNQNIWFGLNNGISKTEHNQGLSYWDKNAGLKNLINSVIRFNGIVYLASFTKVYFIDKNSQIQEVKNIPIGQNWCFLETNSIKSLLVGTSDGIYEITRDKAVQIYKGRTAYKLYQSIKNPSRILATDQNDFISLKYKSGKWVHEGKWEGINDNIRGIIEDKNGEIWLGTFRNGVIRIAPDYENITKPKKVRYYTKKDGFISLKNILPFKFKNKIIWGTEHGLYIYNSQTDHLEPFCELGEQFCNGSRDVFSLVEMPDGKIWICPLENKNADIGYLQPNSNGGYDWVYTPFRRIPEMFIPAFYAEPSGILWIGGSEGIYRYDMRRDTKNYKQSFNCLIRKITVGADSLIYGGNNPKTLSGFQTLTELDYQYNSLKFEFAAPFFDLEEKTLYSYKLEGLDKDWSKWGRQTEKEYTNLSEGTYTFQVKARNVYDVESDINTYQITVLPPLYRTWWAYGLYIIMLVLFIFSIVKFNSRHLIKQKVHLEQAVKDRTAEIVQQKEELLTTNEELVQHKEELQSINEELIQHKEELQTINEDLLQQKDELEKANATKDKFFSIIAHDLRNPFNSLLGFSKILIEKIEERNYSESHEFAKIIHQSSSVAYELLENLLNWSKSQRGKITYAPENLDIKALIDTNILLLMSSAESKGIFLSSTLTESLIAYADKDMVLTILRNFITNAIKFSRKDDRITVEVEKLDDRITIHVSDTGIGIDQNRIGKLFKVDEKIKTEGTANEPGTGLGLILCKEFVGWHKGKIWVESKIGVGSRFSFTLPIANV